MDMISTYTQTPGAGLGTCSISFSQSHLRHSSEFASQQILGNQLISQQVQGGDY